MINAIARFLSGRRSSMPAPHPSSLDEWEAEGGALQADSPTRTGKQNMKTTEPAVTMEKLLDEFGTAAAAAEQLLESAASAGSTKAASVRTSVEHNLAVAAERLAAIREEAIARTNAAAHAADEYVHRSPWQAVGMVAALA